jgi:hypothetical protein
MAQTESLNSGLPGTFLNLPQALDYETLPSFHRLGLVYGLLIGLVIALGFWLPKLAVLAELPLWFPYGGAIVSSAAVLLLAGAAGWLTSHMRYAVLVMLSWLATAVLICLALGYLPVVGQNWTVWLADGRFANLPIYQAPTHLFWWSYAIAGFLPIALLALMAVLQNFNLASVHQELVNGRNLSLNAALILLVPVLLAAVSGAIFPDLTGAGPHGALVYTNQGIQRVRSYQGDLFQLSRDTGFNYNALASVADQLEGVYTLQVNEVDDAWSSAIVTAHFESGAWVNCRVNIDQLGATYFSFCFDAAIPFTDGLNQLLQGDTPPDSCRRCKVTADPTWQQWLQARANRFEGIPEWQRLAQYGRFVLMQATNANTTITCLLEGSEDVRLVSCEEIGE